MSNDEYGKAQVLPHLSLTERVATSMAIMAYARLAMIAVGIFTPMMLGIAGYAANRFITAIDRQQEKQEELSREFAKLDVKVVNIVTDQSTAMRNVADRIDTGEKTLNDRINMISSWVQQLTAKFDEGMKYVYQNVRPPPPGGR